MGRNKTENKDASPRLDDIDNRILEAMLHNARISNAALAKIVGLSESATLERVRRLEKSGIIKGYVTRVDPKVLGHKVTALVTIRLASHSLDHIDEFHQAVRSDPQVLSCFAVMGTCDYVAHVAAEDVAALDEFLTERLLRLKAVERTESMFVLKYVKKFYENTEPEES